MEARKATEVHTVWKTDNGLMHKTPEGKVIPGRIDHLQLVTGDAIRTILERDDVSEVVATVTIANGAKLINYATKHFTKPA